METKICTKCKQEKPIIDFHWRNKSKGTRRSECKECHNKFMSERYSSNKQRVNLLKKEQCCIKCGYNKCLEALEYHHIDETTKIDTVARLSVHSNTSDVMNEIKKCVLLCANCHREFHTLQRQRNIPLKDFLENDYEFGGVVQR